MITKIILGLFLIGLMASPLPLSAQAEPEIAFLIAGELDLTTDRPIPVEQVVDGGVTAFIKFEPKSKISFFDCPKKQQKILCSFRGAVFETKVSGVYHFGTTLTLADIGPNTVAVIAMNVQHELIQGAEDVQLGKSARPFTGTGGTLSGALTLSLKDAPGSVGITLFCDGVGPCIIDISRSLFFGHLVYEKSVEKK